MAVQDESMGAYGYIRIEIIQNSQNQAANTSNITIRGLIRKTNSGTISDNTEHCYSKLEGTTVYSKQTNFSVPDLLWKTMITKTIDVVHDANGYFTATGTFTFGPTTTKTFGSSKDAVGPLSYALTRIPKLPLTMVKPTVSLSVPTSINVSWLAPDLMGSPLVRYEVGYSTVNSTDTLTIISAGASLSKTITGLPIATTQYIFVRAVNGVGAGPWSPVSSCAIPNVPTKVTTRSMAFVSPRSLNVVWVAPSSPGAAIDAGFVRWNTNNDPNSTVGGGEASVPADSNFYQITGLANATRYYVFIQSHNSQGWSVASDSLNYLIPDVPNAPVAPTLAFTPPTTVTTSFVAPSDGGSAITEYLVEYADNAVFTNLIQLNAASSPKVITNLIPGKSYWIRVKAINAQGTSVPSPSTPIQILSGPRVVYNGVYKTTIAYVVGDDYQWHIAIPYRRNATEGYDNAGG